MQHSHNDSDADDRRGLDRRVGVLERQFADLANKVDRVGQEQTHLREIIETRFRIVDRGIEMVSSQISGLGGSIQNMAGDSNNTAAGRALGKDITNIAHHQAAMEERLDEVKKVQDEMKAEVDQARGAIAFARAIGMSSLLLALGTIGFWFLKVVKVIP